MALSDIYDFEKAVEPACKTILAGLGLTCYTTQDDPQFQRELPRLEVVFNLGAGQNRFVFIDPATGLPPALAVGMAAGNQNYLFSRESAWDCTLTFSAITTANMAAHAAYRVQARAALASIWLSINNTDSMQHHALKLSGDGGNSPMEESQDKAFYLTSLVFKGKISVQADAWILIASNGTN